MFSSTPDTSMLISSSQGREGGGGGAEGGNQAERRVVGESSKDGQLVRSPSKQSPIEYLDDYEDDVGDDEDEDEDNYQIEVDLDIPDSPPPIRRTPPGVNNNSRGNNARPVSSDVFTDKDEESFNDDHFFDRK